jgi:hypothetical protein
LGIADRNQEYMKKGPGADRNNGRRWCAPSGDVGAPTLAQHLHRGVAAMDCWAADGALSRHQVRAACRAGWYTEHRPTLRHSFHSMADKSTSTRAMQHTPQPTPGICNREIKIEWTWRNSVSNWKEEEKQIFNPVSSPAMRLLQPPSTASCTRHELTGGKLWLLVVAAQLHSAAE